MAYDVFISHAPSDKEIAEVISAALASEKISCVIAPRISKSLTAEQSAVVQEILSQSRLMLLLLTANANRFLPLIRELEHAAKKGIAIIPVSLEGTAIDPSIQFFIGPPIATLTDLAVWQLRELASQIKERLDKIRERIERAPRPAVEEKRYCFHCGGAIRTTAKFCPHCGTEQKISAHRKGAPNAVDPGNRNVIEDRGDSRSSPKPVDLPIKNPATPRADSRAEPIPVNSTPPADHSAQPSVPSDSAADLHSIDPSLLAPTDRLTDSPTEAPRARPRPVTDAQSDAVDCTVFARTEAQQGESVFIQVFTHMPEQGEDAARLAREFDSEARRRGFTSLETEIRRGSRLMFHLSMPG
ncbi:MAG TPA: TIR domain-containing protein, partial [Blastocatellia bacterium]